MGDAAGYRPGAVWQDGVMERIAGLASRVGALAGLAAGWALVPAAAPIA